MLFTSPIQFAFLSAVSYAIFASMLGTASAQTRAAKLRSIESLSYEASVAQLDPLSPVDYEEAVGNDTWLWQYRNWHFDRCTLWFKDRLLTSSNRREWHFTKVSSLNLNENSIPLERQGKHGVGLRITTDGLQEKITRYHESGKKPTIIGQYYINFGSIRRAEKVRMLLRHAIQLCKAQQSEKDRVQSGG